MMRTPAAPSRRVAPWLLPPVLIGLLVACGDHGGTGGDAGPPPDVGPRPEAWPEPNAWSWNGSWTPADGDFPLAGLYDDEYLDGHLDAQGNPTPVLPPGAWDWDDGNDDLANWRNFAGNLGSFELRVDTQGRAFGWTLVPVAPGACDYSGPAAYFEGSSGVDWLDLGPAGSVHSFGSGNLGDGPDVLVFRSSWSLDFRTGASSSGALRDDDLVVGGCGANPDGSFDVTTTTIHTGPGRDWVFVRDLDRAAVDLGNGADGRTDTLDPDDGDDLVVLRGNTHDFRVFGGAGNDLAVWYVDDNVQTTTWLGPNFFGGGGDGNALWDDPGVDRLVLVVPPGTPVLTTTPTPAGSLLVRATDGTFVPDAPTQADDFARYCGECGTGPDGRRTVILEYVSVSGAVATGYFYVTAFEELQLGDGDDAVVYRIDDVNGALIPAPDLEPVTAPPWPAHLCP